MKEIWRDIPGYEGFYQASDCGRVRSLDRVVNGRLLRGKVLKQHKVKAGYMYVGLCVDGVNVKYPVHRLVAMAFLKKQPDFNVVDHINANPADNRVCNLRWGDYRINYRNANRTGHLGSRSFVKVRRSDGVVFESMASAARALGVSKTAVIANVHGRTKTCKGYSFERVA